jgi:hypothetical protein
MRLFWGEGWAMVRRQLLVAPVITIAALSKLTENPSHSFPGSARLGGHLFLRRKRLHDGSAVRTGAGKAQQFTMDPLHSTHQAELDSFLIAGSNNPGQMRHKPARHSRSAVEQFEKGGGGQNC